MQGHIEHLDIGKILQVAESLENILHGCFGPEGRQVLFIKSTGDLLITKDGKRILECLLLDHPVARMIVNSASRHYSITGDGVKSFVLLLCAVLRELQAKADKNEGLLLSGKTTLKNQYQRQGQALRRLSNMLLTFQSKVLDHIMAEHLSPHYISVFSKDETLCRESIQQTLDTFFSGRIGCNIQGFISRLACEYLYNCFLCISDIPNVVSFVSKYFPELHTEVPELPVDNSRIVPGLILHRTFSVYCPAEGEIRGLVVTEPISQCLSKTDIDFVALSDVQLQQSQLYLRQRTEHVLKLLQQKEVKIIFSSIKQKEIVLYYAQQNGISVVDCLSSEEIYLLCMITGVSPVSGPLNDIHLTDTFPVASCKPIVTGSKKYVHLILQSSLAFQPHSLVLCGPVKGLTEQLVSSFHSAFKMLSQLFQPFHASQEEPTNNVDNCLPDNAKEQSVNRNRFQGISVGFECYLDNYDQAVPMHPACSERQNSTCASGECSVCLSCRCRITPNEVDRPQSQEAYLIHSHTADVTRDISFANVGLVFPGAGAFEFLLKDCLHKFAKTCQDSELASLCKVFGNALLCIPRQIHKAEIEQFRFPLYYLNVTRKMDPLESLTIAETGLEPVSCKYQLLASVLQCVSELVTINMIIGVKKSHSAERIETDMDILVADH